MTTATRARDTIVRDAMFSSKFRNSSQKTARNLSSLQKRESVAHGTKIAIDIMQPAIALRLCILIFDILDDRGMYYRAIEVASSLHALEDELDFSGAADVWSQQRSWETADARL